MEIKCIFCDKILGEIEVKLNVICDKCLEFAEKSEVKMSKKIHDLEERLKKAKEPRQIYPDQK